MSYGFDDDDVMPMTAPIPVVSEQHNFLTERVNALEALSDQFLDVMDALRQRVEVLESTGPVPVAVGGDYEVQDLRLLSLQRTYRTAGGMSLLLRRGGCGSGCVSGWTGSMLGISRRPGSRFAPAGSVTRRLWRS